MVLLHLKDKQNPVFEGEVKLKYSTAEGETIQESYPFKYEMPINEQFYSDECLYEALSGFFYVHEVKNVLKAVKEDGNKAESLEKYLKSLEKLENLAPKSKKE